MRQPAIVRGSSEAPKTSNRDSWISTGVAVFAIGAAAVLCFESFAEADKSMERLHSTSKQATKANAGGH